MWHDALAASGVHVPETRVVPATFDARAVADGATPDAYFAFLKRLIDAGGEVGFPAILRTDFCAFKRGWSKTCFVARPADLHGCVRELCRQSLSRGLPADVFCLRQYVPQASFLVLPSGTPVCREWRTTVRGGDVLCVHPAWPSDAVLGRTGRPAPAHLLAAYDEMTTLPDRERRLLLHLSSLVGRTMRPLGDAWTIDWGVSEDGRYFAIDLDDPDVAWHPATCRRDGVIPPASYALDDEPAAGQGDQGDQDDAACPSATGGVSPAVAAQLARHLAV